MRLAVTACFTVGALVAFVNISCQSCPESGGASGSLYCHSLTCAANENECNGVCSNTMYDKDNCGSCGHVCGDGLACSEGTCVEACPDPSQTRCNGVCVDLTMDQNNCGACQSPCTNGNSCSSSSCECVGVVCAGQCINPMSSNTYCGASASCTGGNSGQQCDIGKNEMCNNGTCRSDLIYRGTLGPATTGVWNFNGQLGLAGANAACQSTFANPNNAHDHVGVCSYAQLLSATQTNPPETINATASNGAAVTQWWIDDPTATKDYRCSDQSAGDNPWTYQTAHLGNVGKFVVLTPATGAIGTVQTGTPNRPGPTSTPVCNTARFVPCCTQ